MKHAYPLAALIAACLTLTACNDSSTDAPLPEGDSAGAPPERQTSDTETPDVTPPETGGHYDDSTVDPAPQPGSILNAERVQGPGFSYQLPAGWSVKASTSSMRALTLVPPADAFPGAELAVFRWPNRVGGFSGNVSRWAQQAGTTPPSLKRTDYEQLDVSGTASAYIPLANKDSNKAVLAVWIPLGDDPDAEGTTWTPKLTCTAEQALKLEAAFKAWAQSMKFD